MDIHKYFDEIILYSHAWNWAPDLDIVQKIYEKFPKSYSVLSPFVYTYLEEVIRSTTSEYGREIFDKNRKPKSTRQVGINLIKLAIKENSKNLEYIALLEKIKMYYINSKSTDEGNNRNSVAHGYIHPRYWTQESFEKLIQDIALLSKYAKF